MPERPHTPFLVCLEHDPGAHLSGSLYSITHYCWPHHRLAESGSAEEVCRVRMGSSALTSPRGRKPQ